MPNSEASHILILGGTAEAVALARALSEQSGERLWVTTSLAGRTRNPTPVAGEVRIGGFGGAEALAAYLKSNGVTAVVDATHPFAGQISANAVEACEQSGVPRLVLTRPQWSPDESDDWHFFDTVAQAAESLPRFGRRAFLTIGRQELAAFAPLEDMWFLVRMIDVPVEPLPLSDCQVITGRGPFALADEGALMSSHQIDVLVAKQSGGEATKAKLTAARELSLPVVMIRAPAPPPGPLVESVSEAQDWIYGFTDP